MSDITELQQPRMEKGILAMNIDNDERKASKVDWSTPYDEWLIPILNRFRYGGAIECRAIPSEIQLHIEKILSAQRQALRDEVEKAIVSFIHPSVATTPEAQKAINTAISTIFEGKEQPNE